MNRTGIAVPAASAAAAVRGDRRSLMSIMVIAAFAVALVFVLGGYLHSRFSQGGLFLEGLGGFTFGVLPGLVGLVLAAAAAVVWLIPAARPFVWIPSVLSYAASLSMLGVLAWAWLSNWLRGR